MRNSLSLPAGDYDSLLLHERIASNSVQGLVGIEEESKDARKLINGGMYSNENDLAIKMYSDNLVGYDLPLSNIGKSLALGNAHNIPVSLFESYSGHVNMNDYREFKDNSLRGSMREKRAQDLR